MSPVKIRIATWRRRIIAGSLGLFVAAWLAVAGLGRQATSPAATAAKSSSQSATLSQTQSQSSDDGPSDDSYPYDPYSPSHDDGSSSSSSSGSSSSAQPDLSAPSTGQS